MSQVLREIKRCGDKVHEDNLAFYMRRIGVPKFTRDAKFHPTRKWRFDFQWTKEKIAIEFEGAIFVSGRHTRGLGFDRDCEKYNEAALMGWKVYRVTRPMLTDGRAWELIDRIFKN